MNINNDDIISESIPCFMEKTEYLYNNLKDYSYDDLKKLLACNDEIAELNYSRYKDMNLYKNLSPAILSYEGIQYKYMSPDSFSNSEFDYVSNHLRILSGFYGILRPFDGVVPYRLELNNKVKTEKFKSLYEFWNSRIYDELTKDDNQILDLGAKQYTKIIKKYLTSSIKYVKCHFKEESDEGYREIGVYVKMARGQMVKYIIENKIDNPEDLKNFTFNSFKF